jgi:nitrate/nitrite transporter NarK
LGGVIADRIGFSAVLLLSGLGGLIQTGLLFFVKEVRMHPIEVDYKFANIHNHTKQIGTVALTEIRNSIHLQRMFLIGLLLFIATQYTNTIFQPFLEMIGSCENFIVGIFSAASLVLLAIGAKIADRFSTFRFTEKRFFIWIILSIGFPMLFVSVSGWSLIVFLVLFLNFGIGEVLVMSRVNHRIPSAIRATLLSVQNQISSIVYAITTLALGAILEKISVNFGFNHYWICCPTTWFNPFRSDV